jgi:hypothetical protein
MSLSDKIQENQEVVGSTSSRRDFFYTFGNRDNLISTHSENFDRFSSGMPLWPCEMVNCNKNIVNALEIIIGVGLVEGSTEYFRAVYYAFCDDLNITNPLGWFGELESGLARYEDCRSYQPVLIRVVEVSEEGKQRRCFWKPSIIWLERIDHVDDSLIEDFNSIAPNRALKTSGLINNRKLNFINPVGRDRVNFILDGSVYNMIEGGSEVVNTVTENEPPFFEKRIADPIQGNTEAGTISVNMFGNTTRITVDPLPKTALKSINVDFRSFDF